MCRQAKKDQKRKTLSVSYWGKQTALADLQARAACPICRKQQKRGCFDGSPVRDVAICLWCWWWQDALSSDLARRQLGAGRSVSKP